MGSLAAASTNGSASSSASFALADLVFLRPRVDWAASFVKAVDEEEEDVFRCLGVDGFFDRDGVDDEVVAEDEGECPNPIVESIFWGSRPRTAAQMPRLSPQSRTSQPTLDTAGWSLIAPRTRLKAVDDL